MRANTLHADDLWDELVDRDVETLLKGGAPVNEDLAALEPFVATLRSFGCQSPSDGFIELQATRSAEEAEHAHELAVGRGDQGGRAGLIFRFRQRATALATSLLMIAGMTGVAWAANGAGPSDWYYAIDRALEVIGIGAGGAEERLLEVSSGPASTPSGSSTVAASSGLTNASETVANAAGGNSQSPPVLAAVSAMLDPLTIEEGLRGETISSIAKTLSEIRSTGKPDGTGKPDDPGKPDEPGKP